MSNPNSQDIARIVTYRGVRRLVVNLRALPDSETSYLARIFRVIEPLRLPNLANRYRYSRSHRSG